jgi:probable O-glycosylation ligase (exosortase A-associated)
MRDALVLVLVMATIPLAFYRPFFGLLGFSWLAYMRPQDLAWGTAADLPLSKYVAGALWLSLMLRGRINPFRSSIVTWVMMALWLWLFVSCLGAVHRDVALEKFQDITKVVLIALLTVVLVTGASRFRVCLAVIALSLGFLGLKCGVYGVLAGGVQFTRGVGGMIGDNNDFALALNMALPLLVYLVLDLQRRWMRWAVFALVPLTALTVVFTHSRGGFLSLCGKTLFLVLNNRRKTIALAIITVLAVVGSLVVPQSFYERIGSIGDWRSDGSARGRLNAWKASVAMANDYPVMGVGLDNFLFMFGYYAPDPDDVHVTHNTWLQVLAETGYAGLSLYMLLFGVTWWTLWRARRRARRHAVAWAERGGTCLMASLVAFMIGGTFLNRAHFDLIYHVMGLAVALDRVLAHEIAMVRREADEERGAETRAA